MAPSTPPRKFKPGDIVYLAISKPGGRTTPVVGVVEKVATYHEKYGWFYLVDDGSHGPTVWGYTEVCESEMHQDFRDAKNAALHHMYEHIDMLQENIRELRTYLQEVAVLPVPPIPIGPSPSGKAADC